MARGLERNKHAPGLRPAIANLEENAILFWLYFLAGIVGGILGLLNAVHVVDLPVTLPVPLPDPHFSDLNDFLTRSNMTLYRCETERFQFYVGFADSCTQLGDPYVGLTSETREAISAEGGWVFFDSRAT